jgi:hypothetical protein
MARSEPDDELKAPNTARLTFVRSGTGRFGHIDSAEPAKQEMVGTQSLGGSLFASLDGGVAKPNGEVPSEGVRVDPGAGWCREVGNSRFPGP